MTRIIRTERLLLRPFQPDDAPAVAALAANWNVARMTARIPHPYSEALARQWIAGHEALHRRGEEYSFAILFDESLVGAIGMKRNEAGDHELGYWVGEPWWGRGIATEAAKVLIGFAAERLGLEALEAGYLLDNPASGRVLTKCGFVHAGETMQWCEARRQAVKCARLRLAIGRRQTLSGPADR